MLQIQEIINLLNIASQFLHHIDIAEKNSLNYEFYTKSIFFSPLSETSVILFVLLLDLHFFQNCILIL